MTDQLIIAGEALRPPAGLSVTNFNAPEVHRFDARWRTNPVNELIIHESVTRSVETTVRVLKRRKLGVHLIVAPDGRVTQHGDLAYDRLAHAGGHNGPSVGLEVVTPYYDRRKPGDPWARVIDAPWAHKKRYVVPTPEQAEAVAKLIGWLTSLSARGLSIPRRWVPINDARFKMGRVKNAEQRRPGVYPHHAFGHADGAWPTLYAWLRLEAGLAPCTAYVSVPSAPSDGLRRRSN